MDTTQHVFGLPRRDATADETGDSAAPAVASVKPDNPRAAAQLLEMTAREIDRWRSEAKDEAAQIVAQGREEAAEVVRAAREEADRMLSSARGQAAILKDEAQAEAAQVRDETTAVRERHEAEVARLQGVQAQHRHRLRQHLTEMLDQVDSMSGEGDR